MGALELLFRAFVLPWALPVLRLIVLIAPLLFTSSEKDTLGKIVIALVWAVLDANWVLRERSPSEPVDAVGDFSVFGLAMVYVLLVSTQPTIWLLPLVALATLILLLHLFEYTNTTNAAPPTDAWKPVLSFQIIVSVLAGGMGLAVGYFYASDTVSDGADQANPPDGKLISVASLLFILTALLSFLISNRPYPLAHLQQWGLLQLCVLPILYRVSVLTFAIQGGVLATVFVLITAAQNPYTSDSIPLLSGVKALGLSLLEIIVNVLGSPVPWMLGVLFSAAVLVGVLTDDWYVTHVTFPKEVQKLARFLLSIINIVKPYIEITNEPVVQQILFPAAPEIGLSRMAIYRLVTPVYPYLVAGDEGVYSTSTPTKSLAALLSFIPGPVLAVVGVVCTVFPRGAAFSRSAVFWILCCMGSVAFLMFSQLAASGSVLLVRFLYWDKEGCELERDYTDSGEMALIASCVMAGCCLVLSVVTAVTSLPASSLPSSFSPFLPANSPLDLPDVLTSPTSPPGPVHPQTRGKAKGFVPLTMHENHPSLDNPPAVITPGPTVAHRVTAWMAGLITPSLLLIAAAVLVLFLTITITGGSPAHSIKVVEISKPTLPYLKITNLDRLSPAISSFQSLLIYAFGGAEARAALLVAALSRVLLREAECLPCLCIPDGGFTGFIDDVDGFFSSRRRRLLSTDDIKRKLLLLADYTFDPESICTERPSDACGGISICLSDVARPAGQLEDILFQWVDKGIEFSVGLVVDQILSRIPVAGQLADAFLGITDLDVLPDFDPYGLESLVDIPSPIGLLPDLRAPTSLQFSLTAIIAVSLLLFTFVIVLVLTGYAMRFYTIAKRTTITTVVMGLFGILLFVFVAVYTLIDEIRLTFGYRFDVEWREEVVWAYLGVLFLIFAAGIVFLLDAFFPTPSSVTSASAYYSPSPPPSTSSVSSNQRPRSASRIRRVASGV